MLITLILTKQIGDILYGNRPWALVLSPNMDDNANPWFYVQVKVTVQDSSLLWVISSLSSLCSAGTLSE